MRKLKKDQYDVIVIGGGAAGMMAAGRAAELGADVLLIEKNEELGRKLLITGGGRCNVTNAEPSTRSFLDKLKGKGKFLFSTFAQHEVKDTLAFFHDNGMKTKEEEEGRVFPASNTARSVYDTLLKNMKEKKVEIMTGLPVNDIHAYDGKVAGVNTDKGTIKAKAYILAVGGASHPETGSTGDGFEWLRKIGHTVNKTEAALVPIKIREQWVKDLSGVSHQRVKFTLMQNDKKGASRVGRMVFAHFGVSGPLALNFSQHVREAKQYAEPGTKIEISLDLFPDFDAQAMDKKVQEVFGMNQNKALKNGVRELLTPALAPTVITLAGIDPEKEVNVVTREERLNLVKTMKDLRMTPDGFLDSDESIVTSGGVKLEEIDFRTMQSTVANNLYIVGDLLDIERPSGGYSLQLCWTTGWVAGTDAAKKVGAKVAKAAKAAKTAVKAAKTVKAEK
jgi:predicted Rossmann fold flavoprotein